MAPSCVASVSSVAGSPLGRSGSAALSGSNSSTLPLVPRRRRTARTYAPVRPSCFGAAASAWGSDSGQSLSALSNLASMTGLLIGALLVSRELSMQEQAKDENSEVCSTCRGTGRVPCVCTRWSDNDVGCGSCGNSGLAVCRDCNGGGTKVPVARAVPLYIRENDKYRGGPYGATSHDDESGCQCHSH